MRLAGFMRMSFRPRMLLTTPAIAAAARVLSYSKVRLTIHYVGMQLRSEGSLNQWRGAAYSDPAAASPYRVQLESLRLKPGNDRLGIGITRAKSRRVLLRCKPVSIIRRSRVLLVFK